MSKYSVVNYVYFGSKTVKERKSHCMKFFAVVLCNGYSGGEILKCTKRHFYAYENCRYSSLHQTEIRKSQACSNPAEEVQYIKKSVNSCLRSLGNETGLYNEKANCTPLSPWICRFLQNCNNDTYHSSKFDKERVKPVNSLRLGHVLIKRRDKISGAFHVTFNRNEMKWIYHCLVWGTHSANRKKLITTLTTTRAI